MHKAAKRKIIRRTEKENWISLNNGNNSFYPSKGFVISIVSPILCFTAG